MKPFTVLSIDGGGVRGLLPALVLADLERRTGRPTAQFADLIAGTSVGGLLALALAHPDRDDGLRGAAELALCLDAQASHVFGRSLTRTLLTVGGVLGPRYSTRRLEQALLPYLGDALLSEASTDVLVLSYDLQRRRPVVLSRTEARTRPDTDLSMLAAARATAAAPTMFAPLTITDVNSGARSVLIDGGVVSNNPALSALAHVRAHHGDVPVRIVSLGTGAPAGRRPGELRHVAHWGLAQWARQLVKLAVSGPSRMVDDQLAALVPSCAQRYWRLQPALGRTSDATDDASPRNLDALRAAAETYLADHDAELQALADELTAPEAHEVTA